MHGRPNGLGCGSPSGLGSTKIYEEPYFLLPGNVSDEMRTLPLIALALAPGIALAGGSPLNTLVLANGSSQDSLEVAQSYQDLRGLPASHLCIVTTTVDSILSYSNFLQDIQMPLQQHLMDFGLTNQIRFVAISRDLPYRIRKVEGGTAKNNGITSVLFYGFKSYPATPVCTLPSNTVHTYYESETAFSSPLAPASTQQMFAASMLEGWTPGESLSLIQRSLASDDLYPTGQVLLIRSTDFFRNVRWPQYEEMDFQGRFRQGMGERIFLMANGFSGRNHITGVAIGRSSQPNLSNNEYQPGALGDHLTSFGGDLAMDLSGQTSILDWLAAGASGSYGTVVEPCNYTNKFPQIRLHTWYAMGFNLAEAYLMSVQAPYMGVIVGDPLTQPYARKPTGLILNPAESNTVTGSVAIQWQADATDPVRVGRAVLYVDGRFHTQLFEAATSPNTEMLLDLNGHGISGTVAAASSLPVLLSSVAGWIHSTNIGISADARTDRIQLRQEALRMAASNWTSSASVTSGSNNLYLASPTPSFQESLFAARSELLILGTPASGDVVRATITRLDGVEVTNAVTASASSTAKSLAQNLLGLLQADTNLAGHVGCTADDFAFNTTWPNDDRGALYLTAKTTGWTGSHLRVDYDIVSTNLIDTSYDDYFNDNESVMSARAELQAAIGPTQETGSISWDTSILPNGPHDLQLVTSAGTASEAEHVFRRSVIVSNSPLQARLGGLTNQASVLYGAMVTGSVEAIGASATNWAVLVEDRLITNTPSGPLHFSFSTLPFGPGTLDIQGRVQSALDGEAVSEVIRIDVHPNNDTDFDGLDDAWERFHFGDTAMYNGTDDPDADGQDNRFEFCSGLEPTNSASWFQILDTSLSPSNWVVQFHASTTSSYRIEGLLSASSVNWNLLGTVSPTSNPSSWTSNLSSLSQRWLRVTSECPPLATDP